MSKLAIVGTIEVVPGRKEQLLPLLMAHRTRSLSEPGTLHFEVLAPQDEDSKVLVFEVYRDEDAFELHRSAPSIAQFRVETAGMVAKLDVTRCALLE
jgi:quinol monooxygenase YgiN